MAPSKKAAGFILRASISVCLLALLFMRIDLNGVWSVIVGSDLVYLALAAGLIVFVAFLCLVRWQMVLTAAGIVYPLKRLVIPYLGGIFLNTFLPSTIGGDILRSAHVARDSRKTAGSVAAVLMDRLSGYVGVVAVALVALALGGPAIAGKQVVSVVALMLAVLLVIVIVVFHPGIYRRAIGLLSAGNPGKLRKVFCETIGVMHGFRAQLPILRKSIVFSLFAQAVSPVGFLLVCRAVGGEVNPLHFFVLMPVIGAIALLPVSIGGIGFRDALVVYGFSRVGLGSHTALAMSLVSTAITVAFACLSGVIYVFALHYRRVQPDQA